MMMVTFGFARMFGEMGLTPEYIGFCNFNKGRTATAIRNFYADFHNKEPKFLADKMLCKSVVRPISFG